MTRAIAHNESQQRFEWTEDNALSALEYELDGNVMTITHTLVPEAVGGRGIAADLCQSALDTARSRNWKVKPQCSYAAAYIKRHAQYQDLLA